MPHQTTCLCGETLRAEDLESLVPVAREHFDTAHAELGIREHHIRDYLEAELRLTGATERLEEIGPVTVREATGDDLDALLSFFDHDAFAGNPAWAGCYCMCHHVGNGSPAWQERRSAENREELIERIRAGTTTGIVAMADGRVAAWCNASPRGTFADYAGRDDDPDDEVGSIACFVIAPPFRHHGLARRMLDEACRSFTRRGLRVAEGYPRRAPRDDAGAYHGPLALYLDAGFETVAEDDDLIIVRRPLQPAEAPAG